LRFPLQNGRKSLGKTGPRALPFFR